MNRAWAYAKQKSRRKSYKSLDAGAETAFDENPENFMTFDSWTWGQTQEMFSIIKIVSF